MEKEKETTGVFTKKTIVYNKFRSDSEGYRKHLTRAFRHELVDTMRSGIDYFVRINEVEEPAIDYFYPDWPLEYVMEGDTIIHQTGALLLIDWSICEVGDATIGRPEWVDWRLSVIAVPGPDGGTWRFQHEMGIPEVPYVEVWRRVT